MTNPKEYLKCAFSPFASDQVDWFEAVSIDDEQFGGLDDVGQIGRGVECEGNSA